MEKFNIANMRLALRLLLKKEKIDQMINALHLHDFKELAHLYCDVFNQYISLMGRYGVNTYSQFKLDSYLVDLYDTLKPGCDFDDFCHIIYIPTNIKGLYRLPEIP